MHFLRKQLVKKNQLNIVVTCLLLVTFSKIISQKIDVYLSRLNDATCYVTIDRLNNSAINLKKGGQRNNSGHHEWIKQNAGG